VFRIRDRRKRTNGSGSCGALERASGERFPQDYVYPPSAVLRFLTIFAFLAASAAMGSEIGDTYAKVIADNGQPRSQMAAGSMRILMYPDATIKLRDDVVIAVTARAPAGETPPQTNAPPGPSLKDMPVPDQIAALQLQMKKAIDEVTAIVNQPVASVPLTPDLGAGVWTEAWFHPGAIRPDFNKVDIRATQETKTYSSWPYITNNVDHPGVAFKGSDVEFNAMTKIFYQDRSLPKKKLTEDEMLEINRLYRIIGRCKAQLAALAKP
jgi:hypothetical protein